MKRTILFLLALLPGVAYSEPLNYDYVYLSANDTETDGGNEDSGETFGGFWSFADTLHLFASYDDAGAYTGAGSNPAWRYETRTLRAGIGGHYLIGKRMMIAPSIAVLRADREISAPAWTAPLESTDTGYGAQLDLRYAVTNWFELTAGGRYSRVFDAGNEEFVGGLLFHPTDWLALGALYHEGEDRSSTELTVRWYY
ncbi:MAG TPA: hypothetical protein VF267_13865 [Gammaproteobacteria bacterium]